MNRLQKKAWTELGVAAAATAWTTLMVLYIAYSNIQGLGWILLFVIVGVPVFTIVFLLEARGLKVFDEREKELIRKSSDISTKCFTMYLMTFSMISLVVIGGKGDIPVVILPVMVLAGLFLAQCVQSAILLFQCEKDNDE